MRLEFGGGVRISKLYPAQLPDLFKGDQLVLTGRYSGSGEVEAKLTGVANGREQTFAYKVKFNDSSNDYVARLWATRRVGFLLDEIRIHGETNELRDEATDLARRYGIVTPYTAYLIVEDEDRRRVPMAERSMQSMSADNSARSEVSKAWAGFKEKEGWRNAVQSRSQMIQVSRSIRRLDQFRLQRSRTRVRSHAPAAQASRTASRNTRSDQIWNGRAFFQNGKQWLIRRANGANGNACSSTPRLISNFSPNIPTSGRARTRTKRPLTLDDTVYEITD